MKIKLIISVLLITMLTSINVNAEKFDNYNLNNKNINEIIANKHDLDINISNVEIVNHKIKLDKDYNSYAIITMDVFNTGLEEIELSNINTYVYQNHKLLPTFIKSEKDECLGFVGMLNSGQCKNIKMCVGLEKNNRDIKMVFEDSRINTNNKWQKEINL